MPDNAIDIFIESRVTNILTDLKAKLNGLTTDEIDTMKIKEIATTEQ